MPLKTNFDERPEINLTSLLDVVFLMVLFFMVSTTFAQWENRIDLKVPTVREGGAMTAPPARRVVSVTRDGTMLLDRQQVTLDQLVSRLKKAREEYPGLGVVVRGDGQGAFQHVAEALNACKQAGIEELGITVQIARGGTARTR
jgi:biopolymer transport protein ExbD